MGDIELTVATTPAASLTLRPLSAAQIVELWETGQALPPHRRAMRMLAAATSDRSSGALAELTVGARDALLLDLRRRIWGDHVEGVATCPACGETMEMDLDLRQFQAPAGARVAAEARQARIGEYELSYRPVRCGDIDAAVSGENGSDAERLKRSLLHR